MNNDPQHQQQVFEARFEGKDGVIVKQTRSGKHVVTFPDESTYETNRTDYIQTVDDVWWNPFMLRGPNPVYLVACTMCRRPSLFGRPSHGLCTAINAHQCVQCRATCCPSHCRVCLDGHVRCTSCARTSGVVGFLRSIFFESG